MKNEKKILSEFTREMMGSSVSNMTDDELDAWMDPFRNAVASIVAAGVLQAPGFPAWFIIRRNEARSKLLAVFRARCAECAGGPS